MFMRARSRARRREARRRRAESRHRRIEQRTLQRGVEFRPAERSGCFAETADQRDARGAERPRRVVHAPIAAAAAATIGRAMEFTLPRPSSTRRRESAIVAGLGGQRPLLDEMRIGLELLHHRVGERRRGAEIVASAQSRSYRVGADARGRAVVADEEAARRRRSRARRCARWPPRPGWRSPAATSARTSKWNKIEQPAVLGHQP